MSKCLTVLVCGQFKVLNFNGPNSTVMVMVVTNDNNDDMGWRHPPMAILRVFSTNI